MTAEPDPIACSLGASDLGRRLEEIAALGRDHLTGVETREGARLLRFHLDDDSRRRLTAIVAAESECCPFLDLDLRERDGELVLTIAAPEEGQAVADELAAAFASLAQRPSS